MGMGTGTWRSVADKFGEIVGNFPICVFRSYIYIYI